ncbi:hypothetical protein BDF14DRAFT_1757408 [Spinellus fusiger]|nr:hypothetical protein BDF14DRAFT_1757408 [Spinellus fusiger]
MTTLAEVEEEISSPCILPPPIHSPESMQVVHHQNTYFMDGGNRFISLPTLGNSTTKTASHISRAFEEWLQQKLYKATFDTLPILEDSVELLAEDVLNTLKQRSSLKSLTGVSRVYVKIRTGHIYTYHQLEDGQPLITEDMEDFFQQFPLFIEVIIYTSICHHTKDSLQLLVSVENLSINPKEPVSLSEEVSF